MKAEQKNLADIIAKLKAGKESRYKFKARTRPEAGVNLALFESLKKTHPQLIKELAARMNMSRQNIYYMTRTESYGGTHKAKDAIAQLNDALKAIHKETLDQLKKAGKK